MNTPQDGFLGYGLGLRPQHFPAILQETSARVPGIDWFEAISENYIRTGGPPMRNLERVRDLYPVILHGVSLSIGAPDPLDTDYLSGLKALIGRIEPEWISDHLCWTGAHGVNLHDLLPMPFTEEAVAHTASRVAQVQDFLGQRILLENVSSYVTFETSEMSEAEFLAEVVKRADCDILLDVNNIYVTGFNHGFDPVTYLDHVDGDRVRQIHLAGHQNNGDHIVDTHDHPVCDPVWDLYAETVRRIGVKPTMIERDDDIPDLPDLVDELNRARAIGDATAAEARVA